MSFLRYIWPLFLLLLHYHISLNPWFVYSLKIVGNCFIRFETHALETRVSGLESICTVGIIIWIFLYSITKTWRRKKSNLVTLHTSVSDYSEAVAELPLRPATIFSIECRVPESLLRPTSEPARAPRGPGPMPPLETAEKMLEVGEEAAALTPPPPPRAAAIAAAWTCRANWALSNMLGWKPPSCSWPKGLGKVGANGVWPPPP